MQKNSYLSQGTSGDDAFDIMSLISGIDSESVGLIGQQQQEQIDSLKIQVKSLENELASRNEESLLIKKRVSQTCRTVNQIIYSLSSIISPEEKEKKSFLKKINDEKNPYDKIDEYISFMHNYTQSNSESFNRICDQLRGYVQLIELLNSEANLPFETTSKFNLQQVFFQEAQKTNEFLKSQTKSNTSTDSSFPLVTEILDIDNLSPESRLEKIQAFVCGVDIPIEELKTLFLQEIAITDILRKYICTHFSERKNDADLNPIVENEIRNQIENDIRAEVTKSLTESIHTEVENELKSRIEQELSLKFETEQKEQEEQYSKKLQELNDEIQRLKMSAKDDFIDEISNGDDSQLKNKIISILRGEIEADVRSQLQKENLQRQDFESQLQKSFSIKEKQLRSEFDLELQQKEKQIRNQLRSEFDLESQQKESQIRSKLQSEFDLMLKQKENQIRSQLQSQFNLELQQKEKQLLNQFRSKPNLELQQKENQIRKQLRSEYDLEFQQKETQIRNQLSSEFDFKLQQREALIRNQLQSEHNLKLQQKEAQIRNQLRSEFDSELQQKISQIKSQYQNKQGIEIQQKENQIRKQIRSEYDLESQQKEMQIRNQLQSEFNSRLQQQEKQIKSQLQSQFNLEYQQKEIKLKSQFQSKLDSELRQKEIQIQKLRSEYELEFQQKEAKIRSQFQSQHDLEMQQKESQIRKQLEPQIRSEIMNQISQNSKKNESPKQNFKSKNNYSNNQDNKYLIDDRNLEDLYTSLCNASGISPTSFYNFKFNGKSDTSNQLLITILDQASSIATDVLELRSHLAPKHKGPFNFLNHFKALEAQVAHLDQLHTQTRALLVKQSQIISDLRGKSDYASWVKWALNLYKILDSDELNQSESEINTSFSFNKSYVLNPESIIELRLAIEERATALLALEKLKVIKRNT